MRKAFLPWVPLPRLVWKQEILLTNSVIACFEWRTVTAILWLKATLAWVVLVLRWHVMITASTGVIPPAQSRSTDKIKKALGFVLCDSWLADLCLWALLSFCSPLREQTIYQHSAPLVFFMIIGKNTTSGSHRRVVLCQRAKPRNTVMCFTFCGLYHRNPRLTLRKTFKVQWKQRTQPFFSVFTIW